MRTAILILCCLFLISCERSPESPQAEQKSAPPTKVAPKPQAQVRRKAPVESHQPGYPSVQHTVLRKWKPNQNSAGYGADLLVNQDVTEQELVTLVNELGRGHDPVNIRIFSSRAAYDAEKNNQYGDAYARGYILFYVKNLTGQGAYRGFNEIRWMQEKGRFADKFGAKTKL